MRTQAANQAALAAMVSFLRKEAEGGPIVTHLKNQTHGGNLWQNAMILAQPKGPGKVTFYKDKAAKDAAMRQTTPPATAPAQAQAPEQSSIMQPMIEPQQRADTAANVDPRNPQGVKPVPSYSGAAAVVAGADAAAARLAAKKAAIASARQAANLGVGPAAPAVQQASKGAALAAKAGKLGLKTVGVAGKTMLPVAMAADVAGQFMGPDGVPMSLEEAGRNAAANAMQTQNDIGTSYGKAAWTGFTNPMATLNAATSAVANRALGNDQAEAAQSQQDVTRRADKYKRDLDQYIQFLSAPGTEGYNPAKAQRLANQFKSVYGQGR